jgi:hypothetical protein
MKIAALLAALLINPALAGFGKTPDTALTKKSNRRQWSSTGMQGLDHNYLQELTAVQSAKKSPNKKQEHHDAFLEHHPYASGSFTIVPQQHHV